MTNKTEKTAKIYVPYEKYFASELSWFSLAKPFVTAHHIALIGSPVVAYPVSRQVGMA